MPPLVATLNPSIDSRINTSYKDTNYGDETYLRVGNRLDVMNRTFMKFDLSSVPVNAVVQTATLRLYFSADHAANAPTFYVRRVKRAWEEMQVTWNSWKTSNLWQTAGAGGADDVESTNLGSKTFTATETLNQYKEISLDLSMIDELIKGTFTNNGFIIRATVETAGTTNGYDFHSREGTYKPELVIEYYPGVAPFRPQILGL